MIRKRGKSNTISDNESAQKRNLIISTLELIAGLFNCLATRLLIAFSIAVLISVGIADGLYPYTVKNEADKLVVVLASDLNSKSPTNSVMDQYVRQAHASWCYVTGANHKNSIICRSTSLPPDLPSTVNTSPTLTLKGKPYYQATAHLNSGNILHLVLPTTGAFLPQLIRGDLQTTYLPAQYVLVLGWGVLALLLIALELWVTLPLNRLARAASSLISLRNASIFTAGSINVSGAVTEVQNMARSLSELRRQYDELNSARVVQDAEMRRLKSIYEKEKNTLVFSYEQQLAGTQQKISEFHTKEMEEEFLSSLSHELDLIRSSQQLCDRVLERVNNKYPSSIVFGAFFKVYESLNYELLSHLAFDAPSIQMLRGVNHFGIVQQVFNSGQHLHMTRQDMEEYGLAALAEHNAITHSIYMPLSFQQRNLGMFVFYIVPEAVDVQELLHTLRNVCDIAARSLYQLILYEEAAKAARTDLLTDLPNRKFLEEIFPTILERAIASPASNPVSVIVIHPEQLRSIAENSGRVAVDRILKELARILKEYVSSSPLTQDRDIHLVRFAIEDFMLILDRADAAYAVEIAGRIQEIIENKSAWPGGIAALTVSQGVSTYPNDNTTPSELIALAEAALLYGREKLGPGNILHAGEVPEEYRCVKNLAIDGNLAVFDAGGLLQSVASSQKTGILTVESSNSKQLWTLFENGKPTQARLGKFKAEEALIEFMVTFEDGTFNFQEMTGHTKPPRLDDSYNIKTPLDRVVMNGALAQDNYRAGKQVAAPQER